MWGIHYTYMYKHFVGSRDHGKKKLFCLFLCRNLAMNVLLFSPGAAQFKGDSSTIGKASIHFGGFAYVYSNRSSAKS